MLLCSVLFNPLQVNQELTHFDETGRQRAGSRKSAFPHCRPAQPSSLEEIFTLQSLDNTELTSGCLEPFANSPLGRILICSEDITEFLSAANSGYTGLKRVGQGCSHNSS